MYFWQYKFIIKRCFLKQRAVNRKKGIKMKKIEEYVRSIPDFPEPGIIFRDITSVLQDADGLQLAIDSMIKLLDGVDFDVVAGTESFSEYQLLTKCINRLYRFVKKENYHVRPFHSLMI